MSNLIDVLNKMYLEEDLHSSKKKSSKNQLLDNAAEIMKTATLVPLQTPFFQDIKTPCLLAENSFDGRNRSQRTMRVHLRGENKRKSNFRPWHITWISAYGVTSINLQYSHRCHNENCVQPEHGVWESDLDNKSRNGCRSASHLVLPDGTVILICTHSQCCLVPRYIDNWDNPNILHKGEDVCSLDSKKRK